VKIDILTLFPEMFDAVLSAGVIGRAAESGLLEFSITNIRDHTDDKHRKADDYPFGGGAGQLMTAQPIFAAMRSLGLEPAYHGDAYHGDGAFDRQGRRLSKAPSPCVSKAPSPCVSRGISRTRRFYLSPRGRLLDKDLAEELAGEPRLLLLCGHYEGVDQRVLDAFAFEEISIGDYVLTGGELPSMVLIDAVCRLLPGVLGSEESHAEESIYSGLLEYPQYTRPAAFESMDVPEVLISGDHAKIALWNFEQSLKLTAERRPDLLSSWLAKNYDSLDKKRKAIAELYIDI